MINVDLLKVLNNRSKLHYLNVHLNDVEESIINLMRCGSPKTFEAIHCLIGERENIRYELKELHKEVYE